MTSWRSVCLQLIEMHENAERLKPFMTDEQFKELHEKIVFNHMALRRRMMLEDEAEREVEREWKKVI